MILSSSFRFVFGTVVALTMIPFIVQAKEQNTHTCTNESLAGEFAFTAHGTTLPALGLQAPLTGAFASSGSATFDGAGHFTLTATSSFNGVIQGPATVTGTYAVNSDCSYTSKASNGVTFRAVIVNGGRELLILQTTPGVVIQAWRRKGVLNVARDTKTISARIEKRVPFGALLEPMVFSRTALPERQHFPTHPLARLPEQVLLTCIRMEHS